jgi:CheY-like chemotaxis protein
LSKPVEPVALLGFFEEPVGRTNFSPSVAEPAGDDSSLAQLRLLVAEDNLVNQKVIRQMLKKIGCQADIVVNGAQAGAAVQRGEYDIVFMDVQMPEMDGYEATRFIRRTVPAKCQPWIVALTANAMTGDEEKCLEVGMDAYLSKPLIFSRLVDVLKQARLVRRRSEADQSYGTCVA